MPSISEQRTSLLDLLVQKSLTFGEVSLASGEKSGVYVDGKLTTCFPSAMPLIGNLFLNEISTRGWSPEAVGGLTLGADPIAFAIARESLNTPSMISAFVVRKDAKEHGKKKSIEGIDPRGRAVVIIDDVCTKGGSTGQAIEKAREAGMNVLGAICLVDRQQGATEMLREQFGCELASIFKLSELVRRHEEIKHGAPLAVA